ncbi:hypothetical protein TNCV_3661431 [Trichonephila clavipes]|nr:hypothetical protein TNCV_3661431 [Trichonephila clavipes]
MLTTVPLGIGSNPGEDTDVCKCIMPSRNGSTLNSCRVASPLVGLVVEDERWEVLDPPPRCSPSKLGWNRTKSYCYLYGDQGYGQRKTYI